MKIELKGLNCKLKIYQFARNNETKNKTKNKKQGGMPPC